jgi:hypothetical protein
MDFGIILLPSLTQPLRQRLPLLPHPQMEALPELQLLLSSTTLLDMSKWYSSSAGPVTGLQLQCICNMPGSTG